jgi:surface polysaccharide O-acyltransferase-like enzyme
VTPVQGLIVAVGYCIIAVPSFILAVGYFINEVLKKQTAVAYSTIAVCF